MERGTHRIRWLLAALGLAVSFAGLWLYYRHGFSVNLWRYWLLGWSALLLSAFGWEPLARWLRGEAAPGKGAVCHDLLAVLVLLAVFAPLYLIGVHDFPRQMNTDEIAIMNTAKLLAAGDKVDIYGPSFYSDLPAFIFWLLGKLGVMLGGVNLGNMRLLHAASGVLIVVLCFVLLRVLGMPRRWAVVGAAAVGLNHSLFFLSRMAMRDNTAVLFEEAALICLLLGWQRRSYGWSLLGGFICGLGFYTYYPSRMTVVIWLVFVFAATVIGRFRDRRLALTLVATVLLGLALVAAPLFIANARHVPTDPYPANQFLWQKSAREQEKQFRGTATVAEALRINALHGLGTFNRPYADQGRIYEHIGYGFSENVTGVLLWLGVAVILAQAIRRRHMEEGDLFALTGFLVVWLSLALLLTRAPDYTRVLIVLPFVGYMVGRAGRGISAGLLRLPHTKIFERIMPAAVSGAVIAAVLLANGLAVLDFAHKGTENGDGVGDTLRFQEKHAAENASWLHVYEPDGMYFYWGILPYWRGWLNYAKGPSQPLQIMSATELMEGGTVSVPPGGHGYLLATREAWQEVRGSFSRRERVLEVQNLDKNGHRVAVTYRDW